MNKPRGFFNFLLPLSTVVTFTVFPFYFLRGGILKFALLIFVCESMLLFTFSSWMKRY